MTSQRTLALAGAVLGLATLALPLTALAAEFADAGLVHIDLGGSAGAASGAQGGVALASDGSMVPSADVALSADASSSLGATSSAADSDTGFAAFVRAEFAGDPLVRAVDSDTQSVSVTYDDHAWLLGLFPTTARAVATIAADGNVEVSYPWYDFLLSTHEGKIRTALLSMNQGSTSLGASASLTVAQKAQILRDVHSILSAQLSASTSADVSAN
jgi:hypothetical protein